MPETMKDRKDWVPEILDKKFVFQDEAIFAVVGDMHLNASTPKSRIDDYPQTMLDKIGILRKHLVERGVKYCFFLGDIFHKAKQPDDYEFRVNSEFMKFKDVGIRCFAIFGNHDEQYDRLDSYDKVALGNMFLTGIIDPFTKVTFKRQGKRDVNIYGCHYPNDVPEVSDFDSYNILAAHKFYEFNLDKDSLTKEDLDRYAYNMYLLGHDHVPYDIVVHRTKDGVVRVVRPGSFSRGTAHSYNNSRLIYIDIVSIGDKVEVTRDTLPVKKPEEIFSSSVLDKVTGKELSDTLSKQFSDLITKLYEVNDKESSVYTLLDSTPMEPKVKTRIEEYLREAGILRKGVGVM